jgi:serine/threonine protein kinase
MIETMTPKSHVRMQKFDGAHPKKSMAIHTSDEKVDVYLENQDDLSFLDPPNGPEEIGYIAHYRVIKVIGSGGMGLVFEAEDTHLKRIVAIKAMKREFVESYSNRERFLQEARSAAALESDYIVTVYQVGLAKDVPFLAMQMLHGEPLDARLTREAPLPLPDATLIARQITEGLATAHKHGLVHRDIKPANIWLECDTLKRGFRRAKLLDFGLARTLVRKRNLTNAGMIVGTPQYMSPEQASGNEVDCRSDLFSLGTLMYVMLTGQLPFNAETSSATLIDIITKTPPRLSEYNSSIPVEIENLVLKLMSKQPEERPASAQEVVETLDQILVEHSFLLSSRSSGVLGFPQRIPVEMETKVVRSCATQETTPTLQIKAIPVLYPVIVAEKALTSHPSGAPRNEITGNNSELTFAHDGSGAAPLSRSNHATFVKVMIAIMTFVFIVYLALYSMI